MYAHPGEPEVRKITVRNLLDADIEPDGRILLEDGREFYLLRGSSHTWMPRAANRASTPQS